jgi:hypothetical protein
MFAKVLTQPMTNAGRNTDAVLTTPDQSPVKSAGARSVQGLLALMRKLREPNYWR